jgi:uroporphyrin-III C-methyltransferase
VAIIQNASLPEQRHATCVLADLADTIAREGLGSPAVIVVGDVVQGLLAASTAETSLRSGARAV